MNDKLISRKQTSGNDLYSFCPYCVQEAKKAGIDYHTLPPLFKIIIARKVPGLDRDYLESRYECPKCKKVSTLETFLDFYTK